MPCPIRSPHNGFVDPIAWITTQTPNDTIPLSLGWNYISHPLNYVVPVGISKIYRQGQSTPILVATGSGWLYNLVSELVGRVWQTYDIGTSIFRPGHGYWIYTFVTDIRLTLIGLDQQGQQGMINRANRDPGARFGDPIPGTFTANADWNPDWELREMQFQYTRNRIVHIYHLTSRTEPYIRYTVY
jgi:hypothetical protein